LSLNYTVFCVFYEKLVFFSFYLAYTHENLIIAIMGVGSGGAKGGRGPYGFSYMMQIYAK